MAGYAKFWTSMLHDEWFLSLNCMQRGVWMQLILMAKDQGDTGVITFRSWSSAGEILGLDRSTGARTLRKFQQDLRISCSEPVQRRGSDAAVTRQSCGSHAAVTDEKSTATATSLHTQHKFVLTVEICNYHYYQRHAKLSTGSGAVEKSPTNRTRPDRTEQNRTEQKKARMSTAEKSTPTCSTCPAKKIQELFNRLCPSLRNIDSIEDSRLTSLRRRWKKHPDLDWWERFFVTVEASDFLSGRAPKTPGHENWECGFDFIITPRYFTKITEGFYQNKVLQTELLSRSARQTAANAKIARQAIEKRERMKNED